MAEGALFSLAGKILGEMSSQTFQKAYERVQSIRGAKKDLDKLRQTIQTIQAVLLDAEKKQEVYAAVKEWIDRVRDVLYEADDLFDDMATNALLKQQQKMKDNNKISTKVRASFSKLISPIRSNDDIAKKVKAIRKSLDEISKDMAHFSCMLSPCENQMSGLRKREETKPFVDEKVVVGRDDEKKVILDFLLDDQSNVESSVPVIAIVGIGGMGKTTLAQLVYNHREVQQVFQKKWWTCISNIIGETNVLERIAGSIIDKEFCHGRDDPKELISKSISSCGNYLLVLDDVWDDDLPIWFDIMSLLSSGSKGSRIIVTTRFLSVPRAMQKDKCQVYTLNGLSDDKSWELFQRIAFTEEQLNNPNWVSLGREIVKKCTNVPLAIKSVAGLLCTKDTVLEWESVKNEKLLSDGAIKSVLKLSYDHLPSELKLCFSYCSLYPKDHDIEKQELIYLWIAQGYVKPKENETLEATGHAYFMELFRRCFFQDADEDYFSGISFCKMHDLVHDLAQDVAGKESLTLTRGWNQLHKNTLHLRLCCPIDLSGNTPQSLLNENQVRSAFFTRRLRPLAIGQVMMKFKLLRALDLSYTRIKNVPSSIGDLKHLRYLNLSGNDFTLLPGPLTKLVNLLTLNISGCEEIEALPNGFRELINLRHLDNTGCYNLKHMPLGFGELTCLQHLGCFKVGKISNCGSRLDVLAGLNLEGELQIEFDDEIDDWDEDECWQLPTKARKLFIESYPGMRIPHWGQQRADIVSLLPNLGSLHLFMSYTIKHLPPLRCLPYLKILKLSFLFELEYVEEGEDENEGGQIARSFFPCLEVLELVLLDKLKGWSRELEKEHSSASFPLLSNLSIHTCKVLKSMPLCPNLRKLEAKSINEELMQHLISASSSSSSLETLEIWWCHWLKSFAGETLTSLRRLELSMCSNLKNVYLAPRHLNVLEDLDIWDCEELELWEEEKRGVDWDSLPNLHKLRLIQTGVMPERLPHSLQQLLTLAKLQVINGG